MSEAELHYLKARMWGGRLAKAKRGELRTPLPVGFVYDDEQTVMLDPDHQVRQVIATFFEVFRRTRSARATMRHFHANQILFPSVLLRGARKGELVWGKLLYTRAIQMLHNPEVRIVYKVSPEPAAKTPRREISLDCLGGHQLLLAKDGFRARTTPLLSPDLLLVPTVFVYRLEHGDTVFRAYTRMQRVRGTNNQSPEFSSFLYGGLHRFLNLLRCPKR